MKKVTAAPRRERSFPVPIDENPGRAGEDEQDKNEKRALQRTKHKCGRERIPTPRPRKLQTRDPGFSSSALSARSEIGFERMIFLESSNAKHAEADDTAFLVHALHYGIAISRPHVAMHIRKGHFQEIHFRVEPQFHFIAHHIPPSC